MLYDNKFIQKSKLIKYLHSQISQMSFHSALHRRMKTSFSHMETVYQQKPKSYRVILKNRNNSLISHEKTQQLQRLSANKQMAASMTDLSCLHEPLPQKNAEIKKYVKKMNPKNLCEKQKTMTSQFLRKTSSSLLFEQKQKLAMTQPKQLYSSKENTENTPKNISLNLTLEELQSKIDYLIELKMKSPKYPKNIEIDEQISEIVEYFRSEYLQEGEASGEEDFENTNRKINILEKLMAQSLAQSEILKKHFYGKTSNRIYQPPQPYLQSSSFLKSLNELKKLNSKSTNIQSSSLQKQSLAQQSFKTPHKSAYNKLKQPKSYQYRHQSLPRSTYNRQFLIYKSIPNLSYKEYDNNVLSSSNKMKSNSTYKNEFTSKKLLEKIDFRELDCYQDKFKNLKVNFIDKIKSPLNGGVMTQMTKYSLNKKMQKKNCVQTETPQRSCHYPVEMCSESKDNYRGVKPVISSLIKHKNLATLQYGYRKSANA